MTVRVLSHEEIIRLSGDGALKLDKDALYVQLFLFNDKQNRASDPIPFKIATNSLEKIAKTAIGRPWIVHPDGSKHVRGASDNPAEIIKYQKEWSKGEMVAGWRNPQTNNVHLVAKVFPEFVDEVRAGKIPESPYLSPLLFVRKEQNGEITDAEVLHVQSVDSPGYDPEVAKISGMCEGMLGECMRELRVLGASGKLKQFQQSLNTSQLKQDATSLKLAESTAATTLTAEQITTLVTDSVKKELTAFEEKHSKILGASSAAASLEKTEKKDPPSKEGEDAAQDNDIEGHPLFQKLKGEVDALKAAKDESDKQLLAEQRKQQAAQIVEVELLTKAIPLAKKADRIKSLVESKDDLGSIAKYMQANRGRILGAAGRGDIAEMHTESAEPVGFELEDNIGGRY